MLHGLPMEFQDINVHIFENFLHVLIGSEHALIADEKGYFLANLLVRIEYAM